MHKDFGGFKKRELIMLFYMNLNMIGCMNDAGRMNVIENMELIQNAYTGKRGYAALENEMMKIEISIAKAITS